MRWHPLRLSCLHGLVAGLPQLRLGVIELLRGVVVTDLHLSGHDVDNAFLRRLVSAPPAA